MQSFGMRDSIYPAVGFTTQFDQTNSEITLPYLIKDCTPLVNIPWMSWEK